MLQEDSKSITTNAFTNFKDEDRHNFAQQNTITVINNANDEYNNQEDLNKDYQNNEDVDLLRNNLSIPEQKEEGNGDEKDNNLQIQESESEGNVANKTVKEDYKKYLDYKYQTDLVSFCKDKKEDIFIQIESRKNLREELAIHNDKRIIFVNINGNEDTLNTINIINSNYLRNKQKVDKYFIIGNYIYNTPENKDYNFSNQKKSVISLYSSKIYGLESSSAFIIEEKKLHGEEFSSPYEGTEFSQVMSMAYENNARFLITSYNSLKGPFMAYNVLHKNLHNLLLSSRVPNIILKEFVDRKDNKKNVGGYNWFILFDHSYINCFKAFTTFVDLIDKEKDHVFGFAAYPSFITYDIYEKQFNEYCQHHGFKKYSYESQSYVKSVASVLMEKVNYESSFYDYLVFYNNCDRHAVKKEDSESWKIVNKIQANICFINNYLAIKN